MTGDMDLLVSGVIGAGTVALSTYLGITRNSQTGRLKRLNYLFAMLFILFAMWIGGNLIAVVLAIKLHITEENFQQSQLIMQLVMSVVIGIPGLTALMRVMAGRCRDAGYQPRTAYFGAIPLLQILFWIWLLFPKSVAEPTASIA
jgi:uncharacterized membrane protein YhaH (DUF805 family)